MDRGSVLFPMIESLATERGLAVDKVNGLAARDGELWVETWEEQVCDLLAKIDSRKDADNHLIVSQCMGGLAAVAALHEVGNSSVNAKLVAIAPPLPGPGELLAQPASAARRFSNDQLMKIKRFNGEIGDFSNLEEITARIPEAYLRSGEDFAEFSSSLRTMVAMGGVGVVAGTRDWNSGSHEIPAQWRDEFLAAKDPAGDNILIIDGAGHSLNPDRTKTGGTSQQEACQQSLELGLRLVSA